MRLKHNDDHNIKEQYKIKNKEVKTDVKKHKKQQLETKVRKMETDYQNKITVITYSKQFVR